MKMSVGPQDRLGVAISWRDNNSGSKRRDEPPVCLPVSRLQKQPLQGGNNTICHTNPMMNADVGMLRI